MQPGWLNKFKKAPVPFHIKPVDPAIPLWPNMESTIGNMVNVFTKRNKYNTFLKVAY